MLGADLDCLDDQESYFDGDCDDLDLLIFPGGIEAAADGVDSDCELADDCWEDLDGDGFGSPVQISGLDMTCLNLGESLTPDDCDPALPSIYPGAPEVAADGVDQDCDSADHCWLDGDLDGFGVPTPVPGLDMTCLNSGESLVDTDCDDGNPAAFPLAPEVTANGVDEDCDTFDDCFFDDDGDTYGVALAVVGVDLSCMGANESLTDHDCDDFDPLVNPSAAEICNDGIDNNCNAVADCAYAGDYDVDSVYAARLSSSTPSDYASRAVEVGDVTGDGLDDLVVGATGEPLHFHGGARGAVYVVGSPWVGDIDLATSTATITGDSPEASKNGGSKRGHR